MAGAGPSSATATQDPSSTVPSSQELGEDVIEDVIMAKVRESASFFGEPNPEQIQWVHARSLNGPAQLVHGEDTVVATPEEDVPVVFVSARGTFTLPAAAVARPDGEGPSEPQVHPALYLSLDETTGDVLATDVSSIVVDDLSPLGEVHRT